MRRQPGPHGPDLSLLKSVSKYTFRTCSVDIEFRDLAYSVKVKKKDKPILSGLSGFFSSGKFNAIMGPSGAGKSSLLNALVGFNRKISGTILLNGEEYKAGNRYLSQISLISSYILQHDYLIPELTVMETMYYTSKFKLPVDTTEENRQNIIESILESIALEDTVTRRVQNLSGGQLKRLAVAVELINFRPILFLDEPTTGLDSTSCYKLAKLLKCITLMGGNIICVIHQPNSLVYHLFDTLYVVAEGGRLAFRGPSASLTKALSAIGSPCSLLENPTDILFRSKNIPKLAENWLEVEEEINEYNDVTEYYNYYSTRNVQRKLRRQPMDEVSESCKASHSFIFQAGVIFPRMIKQVFRDTNFTLGRFIAYAWIAIFFGNAYSYSGASASTTWANLSLLAVLINIILQGSGLITVIRVYDAFRILLRENINSWYSITAFYWTRTLVEAVAEMAFSMIYSVTLWLMSAQIQDPRYAFPIVITIVGLQALIMQPLLLILCLYNDETLSGNLPYFFAFTQGLFSGFTIPIHELDPWIAWIRWPTFFAYGYLGLAKTTYSTVITGNKVILPCKNIKGNLVDGFHPDCIRFKDGEMVLRSQGISTEENVTTDVIALALFFLGLSTIGWLVTIERVRAAKFGIART